LRDKPGTVSVGPGVRARQPRLERDQRRLDPEPDEQQGKANPASGRRHVRARVRELLEREASRLRGQEHHSGQHRPAAELGQRQRQGGGTFGTRIVVADADQRVDQDDRQLVDDQELEHVVDDEHGHHAHHQQWSQSVRAARPVRAGYQEQRRGHEPRDDQEQAGEAVDGDTSPAEGEP
jgi:hypothetical protein